MTELEAAEALVLVEEAMHLRMYGENAPGGHETWRDWERHARDFLLYLYG